MTAGGRFISADGLFESGHEVLGNNLYIYCNNDPINSIDPNGEGVVTLATILATVGIFAVKAVGVIKVATVVTAAVVTVVATVNVVTNVVSSSTNSKSNTTSNTTSNNKTTNTTNKTGTSSTNSKTGTTNKTPNVPVPAPPTTRYPTDVTKPPAPGFEWKGKGTPQDGKGNYFNPKTGGSLRPDVNHPKPIGPHWDYKPTREGPTYRWFPDGSIQPK